MYILLLNNIINNMNCTICNSSVNLTNHGNNLYCSECILENWCTNDIPHCCKCYDTDIFVTSYNNKTYCGDCLYSVKDKNYKCVECNDTFILENIDNKLYCDTCATRLTKIKKCDNCNIRHLKTVCIKDVRYDSDFNIYANICDVCNRNHIYPNDCKYCEECLEYVPKDYEHCSMCGDCGPEGRQH
jgi:ribosomal protein S27AE